MDFYTPDNDARQRKRDELLTLARHTLEADSSHAETLVDNFARLTAPMVPPIVIEMITLNRGGRRGGRTRKPGNIQLNWKNLFRETSDLILTGAGTIAMPWLMPLAALSIYNKLRHIATIELSKEHAACLFAMWHRCDKDHTIERSIATAGCKELFAVYQWPTPTDSQLQEVYQDLQTIGCIEPKGVDLFWLREWVRNQYH